MRRLLILGAGGHGQVVADAAEATGEWQEIAFLDDQPDSQMANSDWRVLGPLSALADVRELYRSVAFGIGDNDLRLQLYDQAQELAYDLPSVVHPTAYVSSYAALGPGTVILAQAAINPAVRLGAACIVNTGASVDHDCRLDDGVHVSPGAVLAGNVCVGMAAHIGLGSSVREGVRIGANATLGAGAVAVRDIPDGVTAIGIPAVDQRADARR